MLSDRPTMRCHCLACSTFGCYCFHRQPLLVQVASGSCVFTKESLPRFMRVRRKKRRRSPASCLLPAVLDRNVMSRGPRSALPSKLRSGLVLVCDFVYKKCSGRVTISAPPKPRPGRESPSSSACPRRTVVKSWDSRKHPESALSYVPGIDDWNISAAPDASHVPRILSDEARIPPFYRL